MKKTQLLELLKLIPGNPEITTWDPNFGVDSDVEEVRLVEGPHGPVLVLGLDLAGVGPSETVWGGK
jgi:hypothetical protein